MHVAQMLGQICDHLSTFPAGNDENALMRLLSFPEIN